MPAPDFQHAGVVGRREQSDGCVVLGGSLPAHDPRDDAPEDAAGTPGLVPDGTGEDHGGSRRAATGAGARPLSGSPAAAGERDSVSMTERTSAAVRRSMSGTVMK